MPFSAARMYMYHETSRELDIQIAHDVIGDEETKTLPV